MTAEQKIRRLKPGCWVELSRIGETRVVAERSADGKTLRVVRESPAGWWVIRKENW